MANSEVYLKAMMSLVARQTFPPDKLAQIVSPLSNEKLIEAYNQCDGTRTQAEIVAQLKLDASNFSKQLKKWIDEGVVVRVTDDGAVRPVHVYPLADKFLAPKKGGVKKDG